MVAEHIGTEANTAQCRHESQIKDGRQKPEVEMKQCNISAYILDNNGIPKAKPTLSESSNSVGQNCEHSQTSGEAVNQRWPPLPEVNMK